MFAYNTESGQMALTHLGEADRWSTGNYRQMFGWASNLFTDSSTDRDGVTGRGIRPRARLPSKRTPGALRRRIRRCGRISPSTIPPTTTPAPITNQFCAVLFSSSRFCCFTSSISRVSDATCFKFVAFVGDTHGVARGALQRCKFLVDLSLRLLEVLVFFSSALCCSVKLASRLLSSPGAALSDLTSASAAARRARPAGPPAGG